MAPLVVLITGGNAGLGLETIKTLYRSDDGPGYHIFLGSRSLEKATEAINHLKGEAASSANKLEPVQIDISDDASIASAVDYVKAKVDHIDVLVNNAGAQLDQQYAAGKIGLREMWNENYSVNVTSSYCVAQSFMPLLFASPQPRLVFVCSGTSSQEEASRGLPATAKTPPAGWPKPPAFSFTSYRCSKTAVNMMMLEWKRILGNDPIKVFAVDPGFLATNLGGLGASKMKELGALDPSVGGNLLKSVVDGDRDADAGKVVRRSGVMPW